jgi:hypothetical protein
VTGSNRSNVKNVLGFDDGAVLFPCPVVGVDQPCRGIHCGEVVRDALVMSWSPSHTEEGVDGRLHGIPGGEGMAPHPVQSSRTDHGVARCHGIG